MKTLDFHARVDISEKHNGNARGNDPSLFKAPSISRRLSAHLASGSPRATQEIPTCRLIYRLKGNRGCSAGFDGAEINMIRGSVYMCSDR